MSGKESIAANRRMVASLFENLPLLAAAIAHGFRIAG